MSELKQYTEKHKLAVWTYCLMTKHMHLEVAPERENSLAKPCALHMACGLIRGRITSLDSGPLRRTHGWASNRSDPR